MGEVHYMISEASKKVGVESHVLRHWEEELELPIERTEMGHRYYTEENLKLFQCVKRLKEEGVLLKEIKQYIPKIQEARKLQNQKSTMYQEMRAIIGQALREELKEQLGAELKEQELNRFREVLVWNNKTLGKELGYLIEAKDQLEEERFRKLDVQIRQQQCLRKEAAKNTAFKKLRQLLDVV